MEQRALLGALLGLLLLAGEASAGRSSVAAPTEPAALAPVLKEGRWRLVVGGAMCNACTRAVVEGFLEVEGVSQASFDFEDGFMKLTVEHGKQVRTAKLERALRLAARRVDLGGRFSLSETRYEGPDLSKPVQAKPAEAPKPKAAAPKVDLPPASFPDPTTE